MELRLRDREPSGRYLHEIDHETQALVLDYFRLTTADGSPGYSLADIAKRLGIGKSSVHRIVARNRRHDGSGR